ncbi:hypothetical protein GCM10009530_55450 [Microbispora corallina]|uniref:DUF4396 domain-containing protein n=1 Tax=Microbispora corallina TaxID=83302 RepID=A0ABQ4G6Z8_9ACTN|nr:DUF4396 domain-containing protein [Microbispora corallina]GIH42852.1 hypothetical protein Mco01_58520 [Microbispora corallina]
MSDFRRPGHDARARHDQDGHDEHPAPGGADHARRSGHAEHAAHAPGGHGTDGHGAEGHGGRGPGGHAGHGSGGHAGHGPGGHGGHDGHSATWGVAAAATLHCLTGCAIGEVLGMVIATTLGWGNVPSVVLAIVLAFFFGYALTLRGLRRAGVDWRTAVRLAVAADTLSILVMEIVDNTVVVAIPGAMAAGLADWLFWGSLAVSLAVAFIVTTPVNKWVIGRGRGHAVVHAYH